VSLSDEVKERVDRLELPWNSSGLDSYGISKKELTRYLSMGAWFYRNYFRVEHHGLENIPARGRAMLIGNHSGGVALDGAMVVCALLLDHEPPRIAHAMADKFLARMPFVTFLTNRLGHFTGLPEHAHRLLRDERLLLVFPEGARGTAKLFHERDSLVDFGSGFMRLALETRSPIVPFAFVGGGEAIPTVFNSRLLGKLVGAPYVPFTPWLAPLPLPVRVVIEVGEPMSFEGTGHEEDSVIEAQVAKVKARVAELIHVGRMRRARALPPGEVRR
jgi:1-acyl-sn-glycerol-3-phosphate acyltransferase